MTNFLLFPQRRKTAANERRGGKINYNSVAEIFAYETNFGTKPTTRFGVRGIVNRILVPQGDRILYCDTNHDFPLLQCFVS